MAPNDSPRRQQQGEGAGQPSRRTRPNSQRNVPPASIGLGTSNMPDLVDIERSRQQYQQQHRHQQSETTMTQQGYRGSMFAHGSDSNTNTGYIRCGGGLGNEDKDRRQDEQLLFTIHGFGDQFEGYQQPPFGNTNRYNPPQQHTVSQRCIHNYEPYCPHGCHAVGYYG